MSFKTYRCLFSLSPVRRGTFIKQLVHWRVGASSLSEKENILAAILSECPLKEKKNTLARLKGRECWMESLSLRSLLTYYRHLQSDNHENETKEKAVKCELVELVNQVISRIFLKYS